MVTRQDQLRAQRFLVSRVVTAVVTGDADPAHPPLPALGPAILAGIVLAVLGLAASAGLGALRAGASGDWRRPGSIIVERETGARYLYRDEALHPVMNYASALLILGAGTARTLLVPRSALAGVPRGAPLGIAGAPDSLPSRTSLVADAWTVCSQPSASQAALSLHIGSVPPAARSLGDAEALLLRAPDGTVFVLARQHRFAITGRDPVLRALGWSVVTPVPVDPRLIDLLPAGPDLGFVQIAGLGQPIPWLPGRRVGQVLAEPMAGGGLQYAVVLSSGVAPVTAMQAALLLGDPAHSATLGQSAAEAVGPGELAQVPAARLPVAPGALTMAPRLAATPNSAVCAKFTDGGATAAIMLEEAPVERSGQAGGVSVQVAPGRGVLVAPLSDRGAPPTSMCLVTDVGLRYPLADADTIQRLGYAGVAPVRLPARLVALLPAGPVLDSAAAGRPTGGTG